MLKIAFLFLTITNIVHEDYWRDFFRNHDDKYSILVHAKEQVSSNSWFKQFEMPYKVENSWARTMKAQLALLKEALKDPHNEMFIFCSQNCIPLQSFNFIYDELINTRMSTFRYEQNPHADPKRSCYEAHRDFQPIPLEHQYKNSQWIILNREHAEMMVNDKNCLIDFISRFPHDQEHYPSIFLALREKLNEVHKCEKTMVVWHLDARPPHIFRDLTINNEDRNILLEAIKYGVFFVRKIDEHCDLSPIEHLLDYRSSSPAIR